MDWSPRLVFPGLRDGERLGRTSEVPARAIRARDGRTIGGPGRRAAARPRRRGRRHRGAGRAEPDGARAAPAVRDGLPRGHARGAHGPRADPRTARGRATGRGVAVWRPRVGRRRAAARSRRADLDRPRGAGGGGGAGRARAASRRSTPSRARCGPSPASPSPRRSPGLDVQDRDRHRGAGARTGAPRDALPGGDPRSARGRPARERQRRAVRRHVRQRLRPLVQLGCSPHWASGSGPIGSWTRRGATAGASRPPWRGRGRARCPSPRRSEGRSPSAPPPSVRARCWPRRWPSPWSPTPWPRAGSDGCPPSRAARAARAG